MGRPWRHRSSPPPAHAWQPLAHGAETPGLERLFGRVCGGMRGLCTGANAACQGEALCYAAPRPPAPPLGAVVASVPQRPSPAPPRKTTPTSRRHQKCLPAPLASRLSGLSCLASCLRRVESAAACAPGGRHVDPCSSHLAPRRLPPDILLTARKRGVRLPSSVLGQDCFCCHQRPSSVTGRPARPSMLVLCLELDAQEAPATALFAPAA